MSRGQRIQKLREGLGLSVEDLAKVTELRPAFIEEIEQDLTKVNPLLISKLAEHLGSTLPYIWDGAEEKEPHEPLTLEEGKFLNFIIWLVVSAGALLLIAILISLISIVYFSLST